MNNNYTYTAVIRKILSSNAFFSARARKNGIKTPLEFTIGFMRNTGIPFLPWTVDNSVANQGLAILNPPSVKGWDDDDYWLNDQWMLNRLNFVHVVMDAVNWQGEEIDYRQFLPHQNATAEEFLDYALQQLDLQINSVQRTEFLNYLHEVRYDGGSYQIEFPTAGNWEIYLKVSGLYYILVHFSDYQLR